MLTIGRYRITLGCFIWMQSQRPTTARRFLFLWIFKEALPSDIDKKPQFPLGTMMMYEGRKYHYYKAGRDINVGGEYQFSETCEEEQ